MKLLKKNLLAGGAIACLLCSQNLAAVDITVQLPDNEQITFAVDPSEPIGNIIDEVNSYLRETGKDGMQYYFDLWNVDEGEELLCKAKTARDYYAVLSDSIIKDIKYLVMTLGNVPLLKLKQYKDSLKTAGDHLEDVHPLNFWMVVFTDQEAVSAMHNIKRRKKVWKSFIKGMGESLQEAYDRQNIKPDHVADFSQKVGIDPSMIQPSINKQDWEGFVKALLENVYRGSDLDRYDQ